MEINFRSDNGRVSLKGIVNIMPDISFISIYGPLGINLAKLRVKEDSISLVDLQHRIVYNTVKENSSLSLFNIFNGRYSQQEEQLVCSLCYVIDKDFSQRYCSKDKNGNSGINFVFKSGMKRKLIKFSGNADKSSFVVDLKFTQSSSDVNYSFDLAKYSNFKNESLRLQ